jgi:hypothetical protein
MEAMDERHIKNIVETEDEVIVSFAKAHDEPRGSHRGSRRGNARGND